MSRRIAMLAVATALVAVLSGCVSIPASGPASQGLSLAGGSGGSSFEVDPEGPVKGDSPAAILRGFVAAFQSSTGGYAVAREFLSQAFASKWDPTQSVQVRTGTPKIDQAGESEIDYSFSSVATVDATGAYSASNQSSTLQFGLTKENGQWRINQAPNGIVLSDVSFSRLFSKHALYFLDPTAQNLVPDLRWFPNGTAAATRIVAALLGGPPPWLQGAVRTEFPDGTQLTESGSLVTVESGVAKVDLTKEAYGASVRERQLMLSQLTESLRSIPSISSVTISVEGAPLAIDDLGANGPQADPKVDNQALVYRRKDFGFYANGAIATIPALSTKVAALEPVAATLSSDTNSVAVLGADGVSLVRKASTTTLALDQRVGLVAPGMDENGYVWSVPTGSPNAFTVFDDNGVAHPVATSLPSDSQVAAFAVSRDGVRIAILLATSNGPRLVVAAIQRDAKQLPTGFGPLIVDATLEPGQATDVTWVDELNVATLTSAGSQSTVDQFTIGGDNVELGSPLTGASAIVGGNGQQGLRVVGNDSLIYTYQGSTWQSTKVTVDFIATQR